MHHNTFLGFALWGMCCGLMDGSLNLDAAHLEPLRLLAPTLCWLLDFSLAPRFRCASAQERSILTTLLPRFSLVLVSFLDIQSSQMSLHESAFDLAVRLEFQIA